MSTYLDNIDTNKVTELLEQTNSNVAYFEQITDQVVNSYTGTLDQIMANVYTDVIEDESPTLETLEKYFLELTNCIYFMVEKVEKLGIYNSLSKIAAQEVKNNAYLDAQDIKSTDGKKKTVAELTAESENAAIYESTVNSIYDRAYSIVKSKIQSANTMISTLSKTISRRMSEMQLSSSQPNAVAPGKQLLNEEIY